MKESTKAPVIIGVDLVSGPDRSVECCVVVCGGCGRPFQSLPGPDGAICPHCQRGEGVRDG